MNPAQVSHTPVVRADLKQEAIRRAEVLRQQAWADFWRGADEVWERHLARSQYSATRLVHRLKHHAQLRGSQVQQEK